MQLAMRLRWIAGLLTLAISSPPQSRRLSFDLHLSSTQDTENRHDAQSESLRRLRGKRPSFPCDLKNYYNIEYHLVIEIGSPCDKGGASPRQLFRVVPDTGSADLWVPAINCTTCPVSAWRFNMNNSCSARPVGVEREIKYGDGTGAKGVSLIDTVTVGNLRVDSQPLIQVDQMLDSSSLGKVDGILGLAHHYDKNDNNTDSHSFMSTLYREHPHVPRMFSFYLAQSMNEQSQIIFGDPLIEKHAKSEDFIYGKAWFMAHTDLWLTSVYSIGLARTDVEKKFETQKLIGAPALVDSGSSLIVLLPDIWDEIIAELSRLLGKPCKAPDTDGATAECDCTGVDVDHLPELVINLIDQDDREVPLCMAPWEYIHKSNTPFSNKTTCSTSLQRGNNHQPVPLIFGMAFMQTFYTNFDLQNHRIGFARSKKSYLPANSMCQVHSKAFKQLWWLGGFASTIAVSFACWIICTCCWEIKCCSSPCPGPPENGYTAGVTESRTSLPPSSRLEGISRSPEGEPLAGSKNGSGSPRDDEPQVGEVWQMNGRVETVTVFEDALRTKVFQDLDCRHRSNGNSGGQKAVRVAILEIDSTDVIKVQWSTFNSGRKKHLSGWIKATDAAGNFIVEKISSRNM